MTQRNFLIVYGIVLTILMAGAISFFLKYWHARSDLASAGTILGAAQAGCARAGNQHCAPSGPLG